MIKQLRSIVYWQVARLDDFEWVTDHVKDLHKKGILPVVAIFVPKNQ